VKTTIVAAFSPSALRYALNRWFEHSIGTTRDSLAEYRKAILADGLYAHLRGLSDAELARRGLQRRRLAQFIRGRLYSGDEIPSGTATRDGVLTQGAGVTSQFHPRVQAEVANPQNRRRRP
jgi:hypothetical protein